MVVFWRGGNGADYPVRGPGPRQYHVIPGVFFVAPTNRA